MPTKKNIKGPAYLSKADIVITSPQNLAVALEHSGADAPVVLKKCSKGDFETFVHEADTLDIPIVEHASFDKTVFAGLREGKPIGKDFYLPAAQSLAFIYKSKTSPRQIRYVRVLPQTLKASKNIEKITRDMLHALSVHLIRIEAGKEIFLRKNILEESFLNLRQKVALDLGLVLPVFKLDENIHLEDWSYNIYIKEMLFASGQIEKGVSGEENILAIKNKLGQIIYTHAHQLLGYMDVVNLVSNLKETKENLVNALIPQYLSISTLRLILKSLLKEQVTIRNLETILEVILENLSATANPAILTEYIRIENKAYIAEKLKDKDGSIHVLTLDPGLEKFIFDRVDEKNNSLLVNANEALDILRTVEEKLKAMESLGIKTAVLTSPYLRRFVRMLTENSYPNLAIISYAEIMPASDVKTMAVLKI